MSSNQTHSRRLWRSQGRKSRSVPEGGADFPAAIFLAEKSPNLGRNRIRAAGKSVKSFPAAPKFASKLFHQRVSDSHSLLEFSDPRVGVSRWRRWWWSCIGLKWREWCHHKRWDLCRRKMFSKNMSLQNGEG